MSTPGIKKLRDYQIDYLPMKRFIAPWDVVQNVGTQTAIFAPGTLSVGWSFGSPSFTQLPSSHRGGIRMAATTTQVDYVWRVPSEVDKNFPIYFRHHWTSQIGGSTPTVTFNQWFATITSGTVLVGMSPTSAITTQIPASTMPAGSADGVSSLTYVISGRGAITPIATGLSAFQTLNDNTEALHLTWQCVSTNWAIASLPLFWLGMDIEYTPRRTYGTGNYGEGRKMETNLGFGEIGAANDY